MMNLKATKYNKKIRNRYKKIVFCKIIYLEKQMFRTIKETNQ